jgi:Rrf2 family nitric oxide-sensitive transcriptional repressor
MRLTDRTDLALRLLMVLVSKNERCTTADLAEWVGAPVNHIIKVAQTLQQAGWVSTTRGRSGGVDLIADPDRLTAGEVVRRVESRFDLVECFRDGGYCPLDPGCSLADVLASARDAFLSTLDRVTLTEITGTSSRAILRITA